MLKGNFVNLRMAEKEDIPLIMEWRKNPQYYDIYQNSPTISKEAVEKIMFEHTIFFMIEKKDGTKIGHINSWMRDRMMEIGYAIVPDERGKGYGTEAIKITVDYLFLNKDIFRIQVSVDTRNKPAQKVLEKAGFTREGTMRKSSYVGGEYRDMYLYSILKDEWKEPKIPTTDSY